MFNLSFTAKDLVRSIWVFVIVAVATFLSLATGPLHALAASCQAAAGCDWSTSKAALLSAAVAAGAAAAIAVKNLVFADGIWKG